eukprot:752773-Hanusia_phi.AAC.3
MKLELMKYLLVLVSFLLLFSPGSSARSSPARPSIEQTVRTRQGGGAGGKSQQEGRASQGKEVEVMKHLKLALLIQHRGFAARTSRLFVSLQPAPEIARTDLLFLVTSTTSPPPLPCPYPCPSLLVILNPLP